MTRRGKPEPLDPRVDDTLLRHVRLVKPHLAARGFKLDKWATIAAAVNRDMGRKVWSSGNGAQGRYSHLVAHYHDRNHVLPERVRSRLAEYLQLIEDRTAQVKQREEEMEAEADDEDEVFDGGLGQRVSKKDLARDNEEAEEEKEEEEEEIEEVEFERGEQRRHAADNTARAAFVRQQPLAPEAVAVPPTVASVSLFQDTVNSLRDMTAGLLEVIKQDHAARREDAQRSREERKELIEVMRLALQPKK